MADEIKIQSNQVSASTTAAQTNAAGSNSKLNTENGISFAETLVQSQNLRFSNHAQKRLETRNISLTDDGIARLSNAVDKAEKRGGKESLVMVDDMAFIVNVKDRLVVTALDSKNRGEGVFTQIDSVVFADPSDTNKSSTINIEK
jgi:flagellar operon protein